VRTGWMHRCRWTLAAAVAAVAVTSCVPNPSPEAASFTFQGGGYGHGVGMSQFGAKGRADAGQTAGQILAAYYPGARLATVGQPGVRVALGTVASLVVSGAELYGGALGKGNVRLSSGTVTVTADGASQVWFTPAGGPATRITGPGQAAVIDWVDGLQVSSPTFGHRYRYGRMVVHPSPGKVEVVLDELPMQRYLEGIGEVPSSWHSEALRAQAITARTFAAYRLAHPRSSRYDLVATTADQNFIGDDKPSGAGGDRWVSAVASTNNQILVSGTQPIQAFYSSSNGGHSERSSYVFVADLPYFAATPDPYDAAGGANRNHTWTRQFTGEELGRWLRAAGRPEVGAVTGLEVTGGTGASGRVDKATVLVRGSTGAWYTITGNQLRSAINARSGSARQLLSTKFTITPNP